jgi:hypothetical protein
MSQPVLIRFAITDVEQAVATGLEGQALFFKSLYISNSSNSTHHVYVGIVRGTAQMTHGDYILNHYDITGYGYVMLSNILVPDGHQLRAYCSNATSCSLVASGVVGA